MSRLRTPLEAAWLVAAVVALGWHASPAHAQLASSSWPVFQQNPQHTGQSPISGPTAPGTAVWWVYKGQQQLRSAPSVGEDGTIYLGNGKAPLCAIDHQTGVQLWCSTNKRGGDAAQSQPAVSADGMVYSGARDNDLWANWAAQQPDPSAQTRWRFHVPHDGDVTAPPVIADDGTIFFASNAIGAGFVYAWNPADGGNPAGSQKWFNQLGAGVHNSSPSLSPDQSTVYFSTTDSRVHALRTSDGQTLWTHQVFDGPNGFRQSNYTVVVGPDGRLYVGSRDGLHVLQPNLANDGATEVASFPTHGRMESSPALAADGTLYFGSSRGINGMFYALNTNAVDGDGHLIEKWPARPMFGRFQNCQAAIGADGTVYVSVGKTVYALDPNDGSTLWDHTITGGRFVTGPVIGAPGVLYAAALNHKLYAFKAP